MHQLVYCVTQQHDLPLVAVALAICLGGVLSSLSMFARAARARGRARWSWVAGSAVISGAGVWSTHFIGMLAYAPGLPVAYDLPVTGLSVLIGMPGILLGSIIALTAERTTLVLGGVVSGLGIGGMHFTGMSAIHMPAIMRYDMPLVIASLAIGCGLMAVGNLVCATRGNQWARVVAGLLFAAAITGLHFTAMAALQIEPTPLVSIPDGLAGKNWLAAIIAVVALCTIIAGSAGAAVDRHLARRSWNEAARLRVFIEQLREKNEALQRVSTDLRRALTAADESNRVKSQFLATMGHELRTPLNAILGFSEVIQGGMGTADQHRDYAGHIHEAGRRLLAVLTDVLDYIAIEKNSDALNEESFDAAGMVRGAIATLPQPRSCAIRIICDPALEIRGDQRRLQQALAKLLSNADKFNPAHEDVVVEVEAGPCGLALSVSDRGIGMSPHEIAVALEAFGQADSRLARRYEGAGLGLPLAASIARAHGGDLRIESEKGRGTRVTILLPAGRLATAARAAA
jgi:signal transduction histidine kinase